MRRAYDEARQAREAAEASERSVREAWRKAESEAGAARAALADAEKKLGTTDAEARAEYDRIKASNGDKEYRARHILVEHEYEAKDILAKLRAGESFDDLARVFSKCPSSRQGGDLGTFKRGRMVESFDEAVFALQPQEISNPVRTRFGWETGAWHDVKALIEFDDVRRVGPEHFAITTPGVSTPLNGADKARYPIVNDPDVTEVNRAQVTWAPGAALQVTAGRQRIVLDADDAASAADVPGSYLYQPFTSALVGQA